MKKVAIITWYWGNYGSILQSYALSKLVESLGYECEVLDCDISTPIIKICNYRLKRYRVLGLFGFFISKLQRIYKSKKYSNYTRLRDNACDIFTKKHIKLSQKNYSNSNYKESVGKYDVFICGSDQIWNPDLTYYSDWYWLGFVPKDKIKIAYAPSMGAKSVKQEDKRAIAKYLESFNAISVREETSKKLLENVYSSENIEFVVDPTLLHPKEFWDKLESNKNIKERYLFAYILRGNYIQLEYIKGIAKKLNLKLVTYPYLETQYSNSSQTTFGDMQIFDDTPADFINRIRNASLIITDSFHCSVFSIIYHKDFYVLRKANDKTSQFGRLDNLLTMFGQSERIISEYDSFNLKNVSYEGVDEILKQRRESSISFLRNAING